MTEQSTIQELLPAAADSAAQMAAAAAEASPPLRAGSSGPRCSVRGSATASG